MSTPFPYRATPLVAVVAILLAAGDVQSLTDDSVAVLPAAGTSSANVYSLRGSEDKVRAVQEDRIRLIADALGPAAFTDLKLLPGERRLLTDFDDRGVATTDASGSVTFALDAPGNRPGIASASAAGYDPVGRPNRLLYGSNGEQRVAIHDLPAEQVVWSKRLTEPAVSAQIAQTIALPNHRVAVALNWPSIQSSGVDVLDLSATSSNARIVRFTNETRSGDRENVVTDDALLDIRDLFALGPDELLVTTSDALLVLSLEDPAVTARLRLSDKPEFAGSFISARQLPSGRIAAATVEPGVWTQPHPNHRVYWLDASLSTIVARTDGLQRAPWRVEPAKGHGGSGTSGFEPDSTYLPSGTSKDLSVAGEIEVLPDPAPIGRTGSVRVRVANTSPKPVFVASAEIIAKPGGCDSSDRWRSLLEANRIVVRERSQRQLQGPYQPRDGAEVGTWCIGLRVEDRGGDRRFIGDKSTFEVVQAGADGGNGTGRRIDPVDLGLRYASDASDAGGRTRISTRDRASNQGCGCGTAPRAPAGGFLLATVAFGAASFRRRS